MINLPATLIEIIFLTVPVYLEYQYPIHTAVILSPLIVFAFLKSRTAFPKNFSRKTMKAVIYDISARKGFTLNHNYPVQSYSSNEMVIKVRSAAINPVDYKVITPKIPFIRWLIPSTVGRDFAGEVLEVGSSVKNFKVGDQVFGKAKGGALQEFTVASENDVAKKPSR